MATNLTPDEMKEFVRSHFEDFVNKRNAKGDEQMMAGMYKAMPDLHLTIEEMIAEKDKVVCRNIWRWTDLASGKKMEFHGFVLWRFEGDRIAERWATVTPPAEGTSWTATQTTAVRP